MEQNNNDQSVKDAVRDMQDTMRDQHQMMRDQHQMMQQVLQTMQAMMARMEVQNRAPPIRREQQRRDVGLPRYVDQPPFFEKLEAPPIRREQQRRDVGLPSLNWQHQLCKNPRPNPDIKTLFVDHSCGQPNGARAPSPANNPLLGSIPKAGGFPPLGAHGPFQPVPAPVPAPLSGWMSNPPAVTHPAVSGGAIGVSAPTNPAAILKPPRTPPSTNPAVDYPSADSDHVSKRTRPIGFSDEVNLPVNIMSVTYPQNHSQAMYTPDDLPKTVARTLSQGSTPMSMDFHPIQQTIILVGTNVGDIGLWDVGNRERLVLRNFQVWDLGACSMALQTALVKDPGVSVNRIIWSPDGSLFGVAYSRHIVQIYSYHSGDDIRQHLEIDAHVGGVNDIAFAHPNKQLCIITCGDDKTIKVWDAITGTRQYTFEGHEAPVYSVCPHHKENIQFIFSTALDGKIKAWLYDNLGSRVDYDAPGHWCTTMAYSADGSRLFSCGTSKEGESFIVEWNESEGAVKRTYQGFRKRSMGVVQFDTPRNHFLAAGDEFLIKFWDMDNTNLLTTVDADGGLPASPRIRFNKEGTLLAVSTHDNGIKILANADGLRLLRTFENRPFDTSRTVSESVTKPVISPLSAAAIATSSGITDRAAPAVVIAGMNGDNRNLVDVKPRLTDESMDKSKIWKLMEISEPSQCRSLRLMDNLRTSKISRLIYTNSGVAILALASNAIHLLWKWPRNERNSSGKATASVTPQLWQPPSGILMTNEIADTNPEEAVPCFALSKNDSYVMSASGGKISLFNMMTFKTMTTFMAPPPAATVLAFHPQDNNIIAIGMDDSTIQIYNVRVDEVKSKLRGHSKKITGLAFSNVLNVLVASGADAQICVWGADGWEKQRNRTPAATNDNFASALGDTSSMSWLSGSTSEAIKSEHSKRSICHAEAYRVESKRLKQRDQNKQLDAFAEIPFSTCKEPPTSVASDRESENEEVAAFPEDPASTATSNHLPWIICSGSEEVTTVDSGVNVHLFPSYFEEYQRAQGFHHVKEIYSPRFDHPYLKPVAIGPNHQADIPEWRPQDFMNSVTDSDVFNIRHLTSYAGENSSLRSSFSEEGENDEDISSDQSSGQVNRSATVSDGQLLCRIGPKLGWSQGNGLLIQSHYLW